MSHVSLPAILTDCLTTSPRANKPFLLPRCLFSSYGYQRAFLIIHGSFSKIGRPSKCFDTATPPTPPRRAPLNLEIAFTLLGACRRDHNRLRNIVSIEWEARAALSISTILPAGPNRLRSLMRDVILSCFVVLHLRLSLVLLVLCASPALFLHCITIQYTAKPLVSPLSHFRFSDQKATVVHWTWLGLKQSSTSRSDTRAIAGNCF